MIQHRDSSTAQIQYGGNNESRDSVRRLKEKHI